MNARAGPDPSASASAAPAERSEAEKLGYDPGWNAATWNARAPEPLPKKTLLQKIRGVARIAAFVMITLFLLPFFFLARLISKRWDRSVAGLWCGAAAMVGGLRIDIVGQPVLAHGRAVGRDPGGVLLCNHSSWLDIAVMGWCAPVHFVAKAEVERWPIFGWIGRISDTVFIARKRAEAKAQEALFMTRAARGDLLCLFAEGTSSDGLQVLPFKSALFAMFYNEDAPAAAAQPVTIHYRPRPGLPANFFGWWGRMPLFQHIWDVACLSSGGRVRVEFHPPLDRAAHRDRKAMAAAAHAAVEDGRKRAAA